MKTFREFLNYLDDKGYLTISLRELLTSYEVDELKVYYANTFLQKDGKLITKISFFTKLNYIQISILASSTTFFVYPISDLRATALRRNYVGLESELDYDLKREPKSVGFYITFIEEKPAYYYAEGKKETKELIRFANDVENILTNKGNR